MTRRRTTNHSLGFTLVEVIVVVGLVGLLASAIAASIVVFIRTDNSVIDRLTNSRDLQNISSYLPGDVASASLIEDVATNPFSPGPITAADCRSIAANPILRLGWDQRWRDGSASEFEVVYDYDSVAEQIIRHSCRDNTSESVTVARHFTTAPVVNLPLSGSNLLGTVEIVLTYADDDRRIAASSRNFVAP